MFDKAKIKPGGEVASRAAETGPAYEAIAKGLRAKATPAHQAPLPHLIGSVLHILHGARSLPPAEAVAALRPFVDTMRNRGPESDRFADASAAAVDALVQSLDSNGVASDDLWEEAIEATLSFANSLPPPAKL